MARKRFRYTPKHPGGCPSFTATFIRVETNPSCKGWTTFKQDGDDDHICSMYFSDPSEIEWLDDDDNQTTGTPTTPNKQSSEPIETMQPEPAEAIQPEPTETIKPEPAGTIKPEPTETATTGEKPEPIMVNPITDKKPARRKRGRPKSQKTIEREQRKKEQEERMMMESRRDQFLMQQQQEQQRRERNRQQAISVFAGVLAAAAVIGVIFIGIGALGLLAFFGAGGMLAEADE